MSGYARCHSYDTLGLSLTNTTTTVYLGNVEHVIADNGSSTYKRYLANGSVLITQDHDRFDTRTAEDTRYLVKDHVGSLTGILDQYGAIDQSFSYDAWGQRRNPTTAAMLDLLTLRSTLHSRTTPRGFTGHEMLDAVGIIHMNGRIYDPKLGRFLQADPVVQFPDYSQGQNTYSYVLNNPLTHTDPSGYFIGKFFKKVFKGLNKLLGDFAPFVGIALLAFSPVYGWVMQSWMHAFAFGFATGGIATGSLRGALFGGISAAAFYGIGKHFEALTGLPEGGLGHIATHGLAGGILAELQGGQFGHGFLAAGLSKAVMGRFSYEDGSAPAVMGRTTIAAVVGGTISRITGGKFANGALTSAMAQLFNAETSAARARSAEQTRARELATSYAESNGKGWIDEFGNVYPPDPNFDNPKLGLEGVYPEALLPAGRFVQGAGNLGKSLAASLGRFFGPKGPVFGNTYHRGRGNAGLLNKGDIRLGWSYNKSTKMVNFSLRIGNWHSDKYFNPISIKPPPD